MADHFTATLGVGLLRGWSEGSARGEVVVGMEWGSDASECGNLNGLVKTLKRCLHHFSPLL